MNLFLNINSMIDTRANNVMKKCNILAVCGVLYIFEKM